MTQNCINNKSLSWNINSGAGTSMVPNSGYIDLNPGGTSAQFLLPSNAVPGDMVTIINNANVTSLITQSSGQQIFYGDIQTQTPTSTTLGATGYLTLDKLYAVTIVCVSTNVFIVQSYTGALVAH
jgi:hypothetical protein